MLKTIIYLIFTFATIFYALPRFVFFGGNAASTIFYFIWMIFALLIVGAHLDHLLILDEEKRSRIRNLKRIQLHRKEQEIMNYTKSFKRAKEYM